MLHPILAISHFGGLIEAPIEATIIQPENSPDGLKTIQFKLKDGSTPNDDLMKNALYMVENSDYFTTSYEQQEKAKYTAYCPKKFIFIAKNGSSAVFEKTVHETNENTNDIIEALKALNVIDKIKKKMMYIQLDYH
ncbi:hypothetical protein COEREDRAFT_89478 [Coemansia reversa NRRL 1564]|uniref:Uncharacterized protein n=1 Tax=Coemansia reversa (strain ATCC 12441 / NRRL 1564) TaxID=763665 RepID=A0A2G5B3E3_COERN|nr:hypothetical protein COEREDRAFT_89478 [Coemansia reversa NRRL 1564]|eukprot:PIA13543.1 hypothetical protein COEREDRAFT_89478 [Coemansia reversa NRRL 1564]